MIVRGKSFLMTGGASDKEFRKELEKSGKKIIYTRKIITSDDIPIIKSKDPKKFEKQYKELLKNKGSIKYF